MLLQNFFYPEFIHPSGLSPATVVLATNLRAPSGSLTANPANPRLPDRLHRLRPRSLAGSYRTLATLAGRIPPLDHSLVVLSTLDDPLSPTARAWLWHVFKVPVFEQILDLEGRLLAAECPAHSGYHLLPAFPGEQPPLQTCPCGATVPRLDAVFGLTRPCVPENVPKVRIAYSGQ